MSMIDSAQAEVNTFLLTKRDLGPLGAEGDKIPSKQMLIQMVEQSCAYTATHTPDTARAHPGAYVSTWRVIVLLVCGRLRLVQNALDALQATAPGAAIIGGLAGSHGMRICNGKVSSIHVLK